MRRTTSVSNQTGFKLLAELAEQSKRLNMLSLVISVDFCAISDRSSFGVVL